MNKLFEKFLHKWDDVATALARLLIVIGLASVVPLLLFGIFALFFVATGGFPLWVWLIPAIGSIIWYIHFFTGID